MTDPKQTDTPSIDPALRERILEAAAQNELADLIEHRFDQADYEDFRRISAEFASLHNDGDINLVALADDINLAGEPTNRFFTLQQFYVEAIPGLQISVPEMLKVVDALVRKAGEDLAANQPYIALRLWLQRDSTRSETLLDLADRDDALAVNHLTFAFQALDDVERTQNSARTLPDPKRLSALTALSRLEHTAEQASATHTLIDGILADAPNDVVCANALSALFGALASAGDSEIEAAATVAVVLPLAGPQTQHQCAHVLWDHAKRLTTETRARLFDVLSVIAPDHKGILRVYDQALTRTLAVHPDEAIRVCKQFLTQPDNAHDLSELQSFSTALLDSPLFGATVLDWLNAGDHPLCDGLRMVLRSRDRASAPLDLPADPGYPDPGDAVFICCKAIGYFFTQPVVAASVLVAFLRVVDDDTAEELVGALIDPLLTNYGGELRDYLLNLSLKDAAHGRVKAAIDQVDAHLDRLQAIGRIAELRPSATERQIERTRHADEMRSAFKAAHKESVFYGIVHRSVVLHGRRTASYMQRPDEPLQRFEMDLSSHGVSIELPRIEAVDPLGLDLTLLSWRNMRRAEA